MASLGSILVGVAITGGIAWFALHRRGSDHPPAAKSGSADSGSAAPSTWTTPESGSGDPKSRDGKIDLSTPEHPVHIEDPTSELPAAGTPFEKQARDPEWAGKTEVEIKRRFSTGIRGGRLDWTECHQDQCLLTVSATEDEMTKVLADLETEGGLRNYADHIVLGGPEERDGRTVIKLYAVFDRRAPDPN